jgi:hypothetical protein
LVNAASFVGINASVWKKTHVSPRGAEYCF